TPVYHSILQYWLEQGLARLTDAERERVLTFLLARAEESRRRLAARQALGPERVLGPAGAPYWLLLPRSLAVPSSPYAGLRAYSSCWLVAEGPGRPIARRLLLEHRRCSRRVAGGGVVVVPGVVAAREPSPPDRGPRAP